MKFDVVRAWKDALYRKNLSSEELATLPACPAGDFELTDADLEAVQGGWEQQRECCCEREECETNITAAFGNNACFSFAGACTQNTAAAQQAQQGDEGSSLLRVL
ncbi:MAG: mersacidin/lichenicidin family type 2 lantibiotic [Chloroflexi bacterium]|nr:MAG: mersacidin/lichenicidin family type 2 lantibiotic [Chloroflexota bacterium]